MKFRLLFFALIISVHSFSQKSSETIQKIERQVIEYTQKEWKNFKIPDSIMPELLEIVEHSEHDGATKFLLEDVINARKQYLLRKEFFEKFPEKEIPYLGGSNINNRQICTDGGFNNAANFTNYTFRTGLGQVVGNNTLNFPPSVGNAAAINSDNNHFSRMTPGNDFVGLPRTFNGTAGAVRINPFHNANNNMQVTSMSRTTVINDGRLNFNFRVVFQNPPGTNHTLLTLPFFEARIYDANQNFIRSSTRITTNPQDCRLQSVNYAPPGGGAQAGTLLFTQWICDFIDTSDLIGQTVTIEFVVSDCAFGPHFGTAYIDEICGTQCTNPFNGNISLNNINTIICPSTPQMICGTVTVPQQGIVNNVLINVTQNGAILSTTPATVTMNPGGNGTFCATIPATAYGMNPNGNFEFQAVGNFSVLCPGTATPLNPISDNSANDSGPDVNFAGCVVAMDDSFAYSACSASPTFSILANDTHFSVPATLANSSITLVGPVQNGIFLNPNTGIVTVTTAVPGTYSIAYNICSISRPGHCDSATITVTVESPLLLASNDDFSSNPVNACQGGQLPTVAANDLLCSNPVNTNNVTFALPSSPVAGATISPSGIITLPTGVSPGTYTIPYTICTGSDPGNCSTASVTVIVSPGATPVFSFATDICFGSQSFILPTMSQNGISGSWSPSVINSTQPGSYIFTPSSTCSLPVTVNVTIKDDCAFSISGPEVGCEMAIPRDKYNDDIVDGLCLRVCENSTVTYTLGGGSSNISSTIWNVAGGTISSSTNTTVTIAWGVASYSSIQAVVLMNDGTTVTIEKCIEKVKAPDTKFNIVGAQNGEISVCTHSEVFFQNQTTPNGGNENLYYNWFFGDGASSTAFEPVHTYTLSGIYTVTLYAYNGCSCVGMFEQTIYVDQAGPKIACRGVACEGEISKYYLDFGGRFRPCEDLNWNVVGGTVVSQNNATNEVSILWDNIDADGFGYITAIAESCFRCATSIKIPVVMQNGKIVGSSSMCVGEQATFSLPQWPTTEFNWSIDDGGTGAILIEDVQRNQVVLQSASEGYVRIFCSYNNTLLKCGGSAEFLVHVKQNAYLDGPNKLCVGTLQHYNIVNAAQQNASGIQWVITGPSNFQFAGIGSSFDVSFPQPGMYNLNIISSSYCSQEINSITVSSHPQAPVTISGPLTVCAGIPVQYFSTAPSGSSVHWDVENGSISGSTSGMQVTINFDQNPAGPYIVKTWYEKDGCQSPVLETTVSPDLPNLSLTEGDTPVCGSSYETYAISDINADSYVWSINPPTAGSVQSGQNSNSVTLLWNQMPQTAILKVEARKCGILHTQEFEVNIITAPSISIIGPATACAGVESQPSFSVVLPGNAPYNLIEWDFGDGSAVVSGNSTTVSHPFNNTNSLGSGIGYVVTVRVFGLDGCLMPATATHNIIVSPTPVVSYTQGGDINLCGLADNTTRTVNIQGGFGATFTVEWYSSAVAGIYHTGHTISFSDDPSLAATYYAVVTNEFGCSKQTRSFSAFHNCPSGGVADCDANQVVVAFQSTACGTITADMVSVTGSPVEMGFSGYPQGTQILPGTTNTHFQGVLPEPGKYHLTFSATYDNNGQSCTMTESNTFIIPYKADLKPNISCAGNGNYFVQLLDHSVYYPETPITNFEFSFDGGTSWHQSSGGAVANYTEQLAPGMHTVGIRISGSSYASCTKFLSIDLPQMPSADFTFENNTCAGSAMQFYGQGTDPTLQYFWQFDGLATNLQKNPVRVFDGAQTQLVTLTVTNKYGCSSTVSKLVTTIANNLSGTLRVNPSDACEGSQVTLEYVPDPGQDMPASFAWYQNSSTALPYETTSSPFLTVTQSGQYFVYVTGLNGCKKYDNPVALVRLTSLPSKPAPDGIIKTCVGKQYTLSVPENSSVSYQWSINSILQPQWNNLAQITHSQNAPGTYTYGVVARVSTSGSVNCESAPTVFTVSVFAEPNAPDIIKQVTCSPYSVAVSVANPIAGVSYFWSNGAVGSSTTMLHDGPIQVRAELNGCSSTTQTDLPVDLDARSWVFPSGCYATCQKVMDYIIGPLGSYTYWNWTQNGSIISSGSGTVASLGELEPGSNYQLWLSTPECSTVLQNFNISGERCEKCDMKVAVGSIERIVENEGCSYSIAFMLDNNSSEIGWFNISAPEGEGYFLPNNYSAPVGVNNYTMTFYPIGSFSGGTVNIFITMTLKDGKICTIERKFEFPVCDSGGRIAGSELLGSTASYDSLTIAPNPAGESTTAYYSFAEPKGNNVIEIRDMVGRILVTLPLNDTSSQILLDSSRYSDGTYFVLLKHNGEVVKNAKLLIRK